MTQPNSQPPARASHYVSLINGGIYPAQTGAIGHEDANPTDWRPATAAEVGRYLAGEQTVDVSPVPLGLAPVTPAAAPQTLQLTPDDPVDFTPPAPVTIGEAPIVSTMIPGAPVPPAPSAAPAPVSAIPPANIE